MEAGRGLLPCLTGNPRLSKRHSPLPRSVPLPRGYVVPVILLSQAAQAVAPSANDFWWAQPLATVGGGLLVFCAAWVAYFAQAKSRDQEKEHHKERLAEEQKARMELVEAQREEWEARIIHERQEARRTEALNMYSSMLEFAVFCSLWADEGFSVEMAEQVPSNAKLPLTPVLCPREIDASLNALSLAIDEQNAEQVHASVKRLGAAIREHLKTFETSPRQGALQQPEQD